MPFTPFHMGVALALKPAAHRHFSLLAFGLAQVFMDLEPLVGMLNAWPRLHGWSHTVVGALLIGGASALIASLVLAPTLRFIHRKARENRLGWVFDPGPPDRAAIWTGAMVGSLSHIALDALIHHDMKPFAPFSQLNPLLGLLEHDTAYGLCAVIGALGALVWIAMRWRTRIHAFNGGHEQRTQRLQKQGVRGGARIVLLVGAALGALFFATNGVRYTRAMDSELYGPSAWVFWSLFGAIVVFPLWLPAVVPASRPRLQALCRWVSIACLLALAIAALPRSWPVAVTALFFLAVVLCLRPRASGSLSERLL